MEELDRLRAIERRAQDVAHSPGSDSSESSLTDAWTLGAEHAATFILTGRWPQEIEHDALNASLDRNGPE